jgi:hypothetical protein
VNSQKLSAHLQIDRYGEFWLTDAIRPSLHKQIIPREGYRREKYRHGTAEIPVLAAAVSREKLFDLFLDLLEPLGEVVDVILETSHDGDGTHHRDLHREGIDLPVLQSHLCDFEDLLLHDGCTGIAVLSTAGAMEVQFDEHKLLVVYADNLRPFERIVKKHGVPHFDNLKLITEGEHLHNTTTAHMDEFEQLSYRLGVGEMAEHVNWW